MAGRIAPRPGWRWDHPGGVEDALLVWLVVGGRGRLEGPGGIVDLAADALLFPRLVEPLAARQEDEHPLDVLWAWVEAPGPDGEPIELARAAPLPPLHRTLEDGAFARGLMERLVLPFARGGGLNAESDGWLRAVLLEAARADARGTQRAGPFEAARPAVEALVREILADPARDWRAAGMARRLHCCPDHFGRAFRALVGETPRRFVINARIAAAKGLLRSSSLGVGAIAEALGYGDVYFFSKQFRRETGMTPTQCRAGQAGGEIGHRRARPLTGRLARASSGRGRGRPAS